MNQVFRWWSYPFVVGLLLGLLQNGLFFQLTFTLSSSYLTYLMVTLCWLAGSALGAAFLHRTRWPLWVFLALTMLAYGLCSVLVLLQPFNTMLWPLYAALIVVLGVYPGVFFARMAAVYRTSDLLFRENNGFITGLVLNTVIFLWAGRVFLWVGPLLIAGLLLYFDQTREAEAPLVVIND